ncbi:hypothetical protein BD779DRAFT_1436236 [Infundibulicybe gibba]|nr:hypothetical protein BD779DRAFT_1436236 [Infundibulicybe gibba]
MTATSAHAYQLSRKQAEAAAKQVPTPSHRHAAPSAPWPWVDLEDEVDPGQLDTPLPPVPPPCDHQTCGGCWKGYPKSRFPNWTPRQVDKSKITDAIHRNVPCTIYSVDVDNEGIFTKSGEPLVVNSANVPQIWDIFVKSARPERNRVRALFIENMSGPVLQMLGARYNIEPFFFSSSLNWIPSRYQEDVKPETGDHITITMTFLRSMSTGKKNQQGYPTASRSSSTIGIPNDDNGSNLNQQMIDTQAPLALRSGSEERLLVLDLLAVHLIRNVNVNGNTIISYHPGRQNSRTATASYLHERIRFAGNVYWQSIFKNSPDPTFVLLCYVWHAMYAWDEALEHLYSHICLLETKVMHHYDIHLTQELHVIRAHQLHYSSLLDDFRKTVEFIRTTHNPAVSALKKEDQDSTNELMERECQNLLNEIERLEMGRRMQDKRLKNVMNLVFSSVNIGDSRRMQEMTEAAARDSAGLSQFLPNAQMKQIAYLTMIFLPASFVAAVFGMNIRELEINPTSNGSLAHYFAVAAPMTFVTIWAIIAFQSRYLFEDQNTSIWIRLCWPILLIKKIFTKSDNQETGRQRYKL